MTTQPPPTASERRRDARRLAVGIVVGGLLLTSAVTWSAARVDANSEQRLLESQTNQAASVLGSVVLLISQPLGTALSVQRAAPAREAEAAFERSMAEAVDADGPFVTASLWRRDGDRLALLTSTGVEPGLRPEDPATTARILDAFGKQTPTTGMVHVGDRVRTVWVQADPVTGYAVYAERELPADGRAPFDTDAAYAGLNYSIHLGDEPTAETMTTTNVSPDSLPLRGDTARAEVPFGDSVLTLVTAPREHLGSSLSRWLPLWLLLAGLIATLAGARTAHRLARARLVAEHDASTITELYEQVDSLYGEQRDLFERLQRALLPAALPSVARLEFASRYVAGAHGTDIGGDWYSVVALDAERFAFVVGDVSGRGVDAVAVMAQARFTVRAYLIDGHGPAAVLERCSRQFDIEADGHMVTVLVGVGNARTGEVTMANAGHPMPMLLGDDVHQLTVPPGRPLGIGPATYAETTVRVPAGSTLFCFTDGLVERRDEDIDVGMDRLAATLQEATGRPVDDLVAHAVASLRDADAADDIAALALRWAGPLGGTPQPERDGGVVALDGGGAVGR